MLRQLASAIWLATSLVGFSVATALAAAPAPSPPPGAVTVQPTNVSFGSAAQPGSSTSASTGQASAGSDGQSAQASHCGVRAGGGQTTYSAQPTSINGSSGAGTPSCSTSQPGGGTSTANGRATARGGAQGNTGAQMANRQASGSQTGTGMPANTGSLKTAGSVQGQSGFAGLWFGFLLLLALLLLLIGFAVGRRRPARATA